MADLTLAEAQDLIQVLKKILQSRKFFLPQSGQQVKLELASVFSDKDRFTVVANRTGRIVKDKFTLLLLYGKDKGLLRIDAVGADHVNPDGTVVPCRTSTSKQKIAESGMLGQRKFLPYSEMSRTEWKLSGHFCNTAMSTTLQA